MRIQGSSAEAAEFTAAFTVADAPDVSEIRFGAGVREKSLVILAAYFFQAWCHKVSFDRVLPIESLF